MGNPLTQDGIKGLVKKLRKRGDELPNPEYNPDSVMLYQAAQALEAQEWRTDVDNAPSNEAYTEFDHYLVTVQCDTDKSKKAVKMGSFLEDGFYFDGGGELHPNWSVVAWMPNPTPLETE